MESELQRTSKMFWVYQLADGKYYAEEYETSFGMYRGTIAIFNNMDLDRARRWERLPSKDAPDAPDWPFLDTRFSGGKWIKVECEKSYVKVQEFTGSLVSK